jgi:alkanesulfonate monooxygenase SsuD/methylene tetrahydromethanopterin reductase-like flavin-dependent oxidoreductase (luciferase family)
MKLDASFPLVSLNEVPAIAQAAEAMGFQALWTTETIHDPFLPGALIAEHTHRLQFGSAVAIAFARSPANLAYTAWDLASLRRALYPWAGHASEGAYRAALWHALA